MSTVPAETNLSFDAIVSATRQLSEPDLNRLSDEVLALRAQRRAPSLTAEGSELFRRINEPLPSETQRRFDELIAKRDTRSLDATEHQELLDLSDRVEAMNVARVESLTKLAALRHVSLRELMQQLHIQLSPDE